LAFEHTRLKSQKALGLDIRDLSKFKERLKDFTRYSH